MAEMYARNHGKKHDTPDIASYQALARPSRALRILQERLVEKGRLLARATSRMHLPQWGYLRGSPAAAMTMEEA